MIASIVLLILLFQTNFISWPANYHFPYRGYGDFNGVAEFHTGLDFRTRLNEEVHVPHPGEPHAYNWMVPSEIGNGIYFVRASVDGRTVSSRMTIIR